MKYYCDTKGILFVSTPYDLESAKFLHEELDVELFKTASADIVDLPLHAYIASTKKPCLVSVGTATLGEIETAVKIYSDLGSEFLLLHCVSNYPCADSSLNLRVIKTLSSTFGCHVGFSDHSLGYQAALLSLAFGAKVVEKHFTLDVNLPGPDHKASSTPSEFHSLSQQLRRAELMLGSPIKHIQDEEREMSLVSRKSIFMKESIQKGQTLFEYHLALKRPGTGLYAREMSHLIGKKAARDLSAGEQVSFHHFL